MLVKTSWVTLKMPNLDVIKLEDRKRKLKSDITVSDTSILPCLLTAPYGKVK